MIDSSIDFEFKFFFSLKFNNIVVNCTIKPVQRKTKLKVCILLSLHVMRSLFDGIEEVSSLRNVDAFNVNVTDLFMAHKTFKIQTLVYILYILLQRLVMMIVHENSKSHLHLCA